MSIRSNKISNNEICIRHGQLDSENLIDGVGRKIFIITKHNGNSQSISGYEQGTYIEEG